MDQEKQKKCKQYVNSGYSTTMDLFYYKYFYKYFKFIALKDFINIFRYISKVNFNGFINQKSYFR